MSADKLNDDIQGLKKQKRLLINQINKTQKEYEEKIKEEEQKMKLEIEKKYKQMNEEFEKKHQIEIKLLQDKIKKEEKKVNRRQLRQAKKEKKKIMITKSNQTISRDFTEISIQTEIEEKKPEINPASFSICNDILNKCIDNIFKEDMSIQCNLMEAHKIEQIERTLIKQRSNIDNEYYIIQYFKTIDRKNTTKIKSVAYINEGVDVRHKRTMLAVFDTDDDIYNAIFKGHFVGNINIKFYSKELPLFEFSFKFDIKGKHSYSLTYLKGKFKALKSGFIGKKLNDEYIFKFSTYNGELKVFFDNILIITMPFQDKIKYFISNSNFNITYN
jgi:hypothetical protein